MGKKKNSRRMMYVFLTACVVLAVAGYYACFSAMSKDGADHDVYVDADDTSDSVMVKVDTVSGTLQMAVFRTLAGVAGYGAHVRTGRYVIGSAGALQTFRRFRNGQQTPVSLVVPSVRTTDRLSEELCRHLMIDSGQLQALLCDEAVCKSYGKDTLTIQCLFVPNTYSVYWNISAEKLLERMKKEYDRFWNDGRKAKAAGAQLTPDEVMTLASIVDEETANDAEKPMVAGMYINRLRCGMPLQADPTVKYAWKRFDLRRIYNNLLRIDSPFNTYRYAGLPPGPIRIPSVAGIDAVLNYVRHDYLYMCAKEDFSGTHNFAVTYTDHLKNAARYAAALNKRGIK